MLDVAEVIDREIAAAIAHLRLIADYSPCARHALKVLGTADRDQTAGSWEQVWQRTKGS